MAPVIYLILYASFSLIVVKGQGNVAEQLRELKETLRQRDALDQQQNNRIARLAENLQTLTGTLERYVTRLEDVDRQLQGPQSRSQGGLLTVSSQMAAVSERLDNILEKVEGVDSRLETVEGNVEKITPPPYFQRAYRIFLMESPHGSYQLTLADARGLCGSKNMHLATVAQLDAGFRQGLNLCNCGWLDDGTARYAVQYPEDWCGGKDAEPGLQVCDWQNTWNAYCFNSASLAANEDNE